MFPKVICLFLGIQNVRKEVINHVICKKWPEKDLDLKDNAYEMPILVYNKNQNVLMLAERGNNKVE
jgi:hypothetical protein